MSNQLLQQSPTKDERTLLERLNTNHPSDEALRALKRFMKEKPAVGPNIGDLMRHARDSFIAGLNINKLLKEGLQFRIEEMMKELTHEGDGPWKSCWLSNLCSARCGSVFLNTNTRPS